MFNAKIAFEGWIAKRAMGKKGKPRKINERWLRAQKQHFVKLHSIYSKKINAITKSATELYNNDNRIVLLQKSAEFNISNGQRMKTAIIETRKAVEEIAKLIPEIKEAEKLAGEIGESPEGILKAETMLRSMRAKHSSFLKRAERWQR